MNDRTTRPWHGTVNGIEVVEDRPLEQHGYPVAVDFGAPWDYVPRPPFQFQMHHESCDPGRVALSWDQSFPAVVNEFARWALPVRPGSVAAVVDETFRLVLGYSALTSIMPDVGMSAYDHGGIWYGVKAAYQEMSRQCCADPVSIAMWETTAMRTAPGSGWQG